MDLNIKSILAVDCGSVMTTVILIERVEGEYRLAATGQSGSTYGLPWEDITVGVARAISQIEKLTDRVLLAPAGWPIMPQSNEQQGVDAFLAVSSAGAPLRIILAGLMSSITLASAHRATATTYTTVPKVLSLDFDPETGIEPPPNSKHRTEARIQAIQAEKPEAILLVGGTDGGAEYPIIEMANTISMAIRILKERDKPYIIYAGNSEVRPQIAEILGSATMVKAVDNLRPTLEVEDLAPVQLELENLYIQQKMARLPGLHKLSNWSKYPIAPTSKSFEKVIAYIGQYNRLNVIGVNIGSASTMVSVQAKKYHNTTIRSDAGVGHSLASLLKNVPIKKIHRWLPFSLSPDELYNQLLNKSLHPASIPTTYEELMIEHAVAREAIRLVIEQAKTGWSSRPLTERRDIQWNLVIGAGRTLTRTPQPGQAAMIILDGIEPWGITSLALDISGATNMLGSIATVEPIAAVEVAARDTFLNLGTVIAPKGHGEPGKSALKVKLKYTDSPEASDSSLETEVLYGSIEVIALPPGQKAKLEIRPARYLDVGLGQPGQAAVTEVEGGILGIIIDARGRPLKLPLDDHVRHEMLVQWLSKLEIVYAINRKNH